MTTYGLLIFDGAEELDFVGPWEVFTASSTLRDHTDTAVLIAEHPGPVGDVRAGKDQAVTFLVGQVMKKTRGRANPGMVNRLIRDRLRVG